ncbi:hypothetical protein [Poriferisphaera sp. WC338]|uniref:hypothetical protein n=1 Tax=Poriferisphaera sp. WC338 TaxID=3425129 RepID=UPI003D8136F2
MNRLSKKFLLLLFPLLAVFLIAITIFNARIDPFSAYPSLRRSSLNQSVHAMPSVRGRAELLRQDQSHTLMLGSSIMAVGFDPEDLPPFMQDGGAFNSALDGNTLPELLAALKRAIRRPMPPKHIILTFDNYWLFNAQAHTQGFRESILNPELSQAEYHFANLLGYKATEKSIAILSGAEPAFNNRGRRTRPLTKPGSPQAPAFNEPLPTPNPAALCALATEYNINVNPADTVYQQSQTINLALLQQFIFLSQINHIKTTIILPPLHVSALDNMEQQNLWPLWQQGKRKLTELVANENSLKHEEEGMPEAELWDFALINNMTIETIPSSVDPAARMNNFWDPVHITRAAGARILKTIFNPEHSNTQPPLGIQITQDNISDHLESVRLDYEIYFAITPDSPDIPTE